MLAAQAAARADGAGAVELPTKKKRKKASGAAGPMQHEEAKEDWRIEGGGGKEAPAPPAFEPDERFAGAFAVAFLQQPHPKRMAGVLEALAEGGLTATVPDGARALAEHFTTVFKASPHYLSYLMVRAPDLMRGRCLAVCSPPLPQTLPDTQHNTTT